ncbi:ComC/BlpC family peptide pheromone/bacteriocin [Streptococcus uberis]|nr:hypothetical protein [Streptococcus uberis]KHD39641.1 signal peptide protein [Streptococcus hongkongensis]MCK1157944.1 ComC/BlpC family peptide pheromone/bacteriocin [Streptococcus uberis]MCK1167475.1 ComC/BlpC family peptide pheromone/bacteriocin [Streptococcus uberis]MCK1191856.1 ComC/BlpC family peptide pheromone/bacteriocin [Streptococcus uberis]MCK1194556.1 ComC/BlpC family peptide pheromone/bacteriocin [Streptococcus uberis]
MVKSNLKGETIVQLSKDKKLNEQDLSLITGGRNLGAALQGLFGGFANSPTLEQLNGTKLPKPKSCSPYGTGGTSNAC